MADNQSLSVRIRGQSHTQSARVVTAPIQVRSRLRIPAPVDAAFAKVDPATIDTLKTDSALLTTALTYHVVPSQAAPAYVVGDHETVQGSSVTVTGSGERLEGQRRQRHLRRRADRQRHRVPSSTRC